MKKVLLSAGYVEGVEPEQGGEIPSSVERPAMLVYAGIFQSMDGEVEVTEDHIEKIALNHNSMMAKLSRLMNGEIPVRKCPPIQLDHSESARDTVGRVIGKVRVGQYRRDDGTLVKALYSDKLRFLGRENVERVMDGRWSDLSIGADLEECTLTEMTVTPFPAAQGSALLKEGDKMNKKKMKSYLMEKEDLTEKQAEEKIENMDEKQLKKLMEDAGEQDGKGEQKGEPSEAKASNAEDLPESKLKSYLMEKEELSEDQADEKLKGMEDKEKENLKKKMQENGEDDKDKQEAKASNAQDAPDSPSKGKGQMSEGNKKTRLANLKTSFKKNSNDVKLKMKKVSLSGRLAKLKASAKVTPAELKKIDINRLAKCSEETIEEVFNSYENREAQVIPGQFGSVKSVTLSQVHADYEKANLENESRKRMSLKKGTAKEEEEIRTQVDPDSALRLSSMKQAQVPGYDQISELIDKGETKAAKVALKKAFDAGKAGNDFTAETQEELSALTESFSSLQKQFDEVLELVE